MNKRIPILITVVMLLLSACAQIPAGIDDQETLATTVAATLTAAPVGEAASTPEAPPSTPDAQPSPTADTPVAPPLSMQTYFLVYTNNGDLWALTPEGTTRQLTSVGDVADVLLSSDRRLIVYVRQSFQSDLFELRAINADGSGDRQILSQATLDGLYPLDGALHYLPSQMEFIPNTYSLLFNTRAVFDGPGLVKNDDLYRLNVDTAELTPLIGRERGGDFQISPDGEKLAISQPDSIAMADIDGSNLRPDLVSFQPVITYSEYQYYPVMVWANDSSRFGVFIPSSDPLAENPSGTVWIVPVEGIPQSFAPIQGQIFFPQSNGRSLLSADMQTVVFLREDGESSLYLSNVDGSDSRLYDQGSLQWQGWNTDGSSFAYRRAEVRLALGRPDTDPRPLADGRTLRWLSPELFLIQSGQRGDWSLTLGHVDGTTRTLVQPEGDSPVYDIR